MKSHRRWRDDPRLSESVLQKLSGFATLIQEWNGRINLTGFRTLEEIEDVLIGESLLALPFLPVDGKSVLDFGSGAGIPGLVWAITEPSARITSLEIRQKKIAFQKEVSRELGIQVEIVRGLFPDAVAGRRFDFIVSRAIRLSPSLWRQGSDLLSSGGALIRFGARDALEQGWESIPISDRSSLLISRP